MTTRKTRSILTITEAYLRLNQIITDYQTGLSDSVNTVASLTRLSAEAKISKLPLNISITTEDLDKTGINPTTSDSYGVEPSDESSYD